jgi:hypothetical protein
VGLDNLGSESETCVGSRVYLVGVSISFEKKFYRLPFTPPPLWFAVSVLHREGDRPTSEVDLSQGGAVPLERSGVLPEGGWADCLTGHGLAGSFCACV